ARGLEHAIVDGDLDPDRVTGADDRDGGALEARAAHVYSDGRDAAVITDAPRAGEHARRGEDPQRDGALAELVGGPLQEAPDAVAAHLGGGAVAVEQDHLEVGPGRGAARHEAVGADAEAAAADRAGPLGGHGALRLRSRREEDEIVAQTVIFGEVH